MQVRSPKIARDRRGGLCLFALNEDGRCVTRSQIGPRGTWSDWIDMGIDASALCVARDPNLLLQLFVIGPDHAAWNVSQLADGTGWGDWRSLGGALTSIAVGAHRDGHLELYAIQSDGSVARARQSAPGAQSYKPWASLGGLVKKLIAAPDARGAMNLFGIGGDDAVWITTQQGGSDVWSAWKSLGGKVLDLVPGDARDGALEVFGIGTDDRIWQTTMAPSGQWSAWERRGRATTSQFTLATAADGRIELFAIGHDDHAVWHLPQAEANGAWGTWVCLDGSVRELSAWSDDDGRIVLLAVGLNGALECISQPDPEVDAWSQWGNFPKNMPSVARAHSETLASVGRGARPSRASSPTGELIPGALFARDYKIEKLLARGGMGAVYIAEQVSTGKQRALKIMLPDVLADEGARERFVEEARATAAIESDHVVETVAAGIDDDSNTPWLAMELLKGTTLEDMVAKDPAWGQQHTRELMAQLGHALAATHRAGIVHRDLKPANLFLEAPRRRGVPFTMKLLDFGIAKTLQGRKDAASTRAVGTPWWMAPEQAQAGAAMTPATDVWALGLVTFYALTGREFWRTAHVPNATLSHILMEMLVESVPRASARAEALGRSGALPSGFDDWFACCVVHDPSARFQDGGAATEALDVVLSRP